MINIRLLLILLLTLASTSVLADRKDHDDHSSAHDGPPLISLMGHMQTYAHKLGLSIQAANRPLARFYAHEVEEVIEAVERIDEYDGIRVSHLLQETLKPAFEGLEAALDSGDQAGIDTRYEAMLDSCNACHRAAERGYIVIERSDLNPYPQRFAPVW
jgi:hypothetical protein